MLKTIKDFTKHLPVVGLIASMSLGAAPVVWAQASGTTGGVGFSVSAGDHYRRVALRYETPSFWHYEFADGWGRLDAVGEFGLAYWSASSARHPDHLWQLSATPFLRWWASEHVFVEAGIGANAFHRTRFADRSLSTAFQFGDHLGVAYQINQNHRIGLRYSHFSNANIKKPNQGLDILQLNYLHHF